MKKNYFIPIRGVLLCTLLWLLTTVVFAQNTKISGQVTDNQGTGIPGVSIIIKGASSGTVSDGTGNYSLNAPASGTLVFSFIGYRSQEIVINGKSTVNVGLLEDATILSEVVVTGYTIDDKRSTTGAVSIVKAKDLVVRPTGNVEQMLQGRVAGLNVVTNGQPGSTSQVRVRGFGAFGGNEPLYVVDGVPVSNTDFLSPNDIETTTVLKDAASASIYGARAANGVIVYTTKKGSRKNKRMQVSYDGLYGSTNPGTGQAMMNPTDFATWTWNATKNAASQLGETPVFNHPQFGTGSSPVIPDYLNVGGKSGVTGSVDLAAERLKYNVSPAAGSIYQVVRANKAGTDWYDAITRTAPLQRHSLGFSGGNDNARYYVSMAMQDQKGILLSNSFKRYSFRVNSEFDITKNIRIGENIQFTYRQVLGQSGGGGGQGIAADENDFLQAFRMPSIIPVYDEFGGYAGTAAKGFNNPRNPVANQDGLASNRNFAVSGTGNIYVEVEPIKGLVLKSSLGLNGVNGSGFGYGRLQYENSENNSAFSYSENSFQQLGYVISNTAAYKQAFGKHNVDVIVGQEALNTGAGRNMNASGQSPFSTDLDFVTITNVGSRQVGSNLFRGVNFESYFGRAVYNYNDKYYVTGVVRRDGSSRFGVNSRYGVFPAFSGAWRISAEPFMKELTFVTDLKIRGGYGTMGNSNNVDPNNQYSLYGASLGASAYDINGSNTSVADGFYRTRIGNSDAKWETSITKNIGFDGTFLNGKLSIVFDLWQKDTKDLLFQVPIAATNGPYASAPSVNIGQMVNKGIDIEITNRGRITKDLSYDMTFINSYLKNEIVYLAPGLNYLTTVDPGFRGINPIRNQLNQSISSFFGYKVQGLFQSKEEVNSAAKQDGAGIGRFRYEDIDGNGKIDALDRTYLGSPVPTFTGGYTLDLKYKGFDLSAYLYYSYGNKIFNVSKWFTDFYPSFAGAAISERVKQSWSSTNTGATTPIFETASNFSTNTQSNSFYVEDGSYIRLQNVTLGYTPSASIMNKIGASRVRVFVSSNNLFTLTKYQGLDPSVGGNADTNFGIDVGNYPNTRGWTVGLSLGF